MLGRGGGGETYEEVGEEYGLQADEVAWGNNPVQPAPGYLPDESVYTQGVMEDVSPLVDSVPAQGMSYAEGDFGGEVMFDRNIAPEGRKGRRRAKSFGGEANSARPKIQKHYPPMLPNDSKAKCRVAIYIHGRRYYHSDMDGRPRVVDASKWHERVYRDRRVMAYFGSSHIYYVYSEDWPLNS